MSSTLVNWMDWNPGLFEKAKAEHKPVLLAISASWCHWCHVMDRTTYADPKVVSQINSRTIPVRVDADRRPDLDHRFNMGGWPTVAFLTPEQEIIAGATYLPPEEFLALLDAAEQAYRTGVHAPRPSGYTKTPVMDVAEPLTTTLHEALALYDPQYGGFGTQPKFPHAELLRWLLVRYINTSDQRLRELLTNTLDAMAQGGIRDNKRGGFFRYSTKRDWSVPHFEKMLNDNCALASLYMDASIALVRPQYREVAKSTIDYLLNTLYMQEYQGFAGSQAADERYYKGEKSQPPPIDRVIISGWNAMASTTLLKAYAFFRDEGFQELATGLLDSIFEKMFSEDMGIARFFEGETQAPNVRPYMLEDNALVLLACIEAYQATRQKLYISRAKSIAKLIRTVYTDSETGLLKDVVGQEGLQTRTPLAENSLAAQALIRLSRLDQDENRSAPSDFDFAAGLLKSLAYEASRSGIFAAEYCIAAEELSGCHVEIAVVGNQSDPRTKELRFAALTVPVFPKTTLLLDIATDADTIALKGYPALDKPVAYVCVNRTCAPPVATPEELVELVSKSRDPATQGNSSRSEASRQL
ncbi:MAG TPA: thioredoxin domain-containing protein [Firmicutes bacterium]|nr:thioredoxin domain-containing protein [Bacillota bacterium]